MESITLHYQRQQMLKSLQQSCKRNALLRGNNFSMIRLGFSITIWVESGLKHHLKM